MLERVNRGSRIKESIEGKLIFERVEEFEIKDAKEARLSLDNIDTALAQIDFNIEKLQKQKETLSFERSEILKFMSNQKA